MAQPKKICRNQIDKTCEQYLGQMVKDKKRWYKKCRGIWKGLRLQPSDGRTGGMINYQIFNSVRQIG